MLPRLSIVLVALMTLHPRPAAENDGKVAGPEISLAGKPAAPPSAETPLPTARPAPVPAQPGAVRVRVLVTGADGKALPAADAVVWFPGLSGPSPAAPPRMSSREKRFEPRVLAVPKGTTVAFPNYDKIFHNVFSLSEASQFDLGLYRNGAARTTKFDTPGVVRIYCNIHPQMAAFVVVLDGSLYGQTGRDGVAVVAAVPAGRQTLKVWDERGGEWTGTVVVPAGAIVERHSPARRFDLEGPAPQEQAREGLPSAGRR